MTKLELQQEVVRLQAALAAATPLAAEISTMRATIKAQDTVISELSLKLKGQIKRGNTLKLAVSNNVVPIVRSFADATAIARERGITVQAAMRVAN